MKKIFAFILATIMVMSLVPASVFAALSNDPGCPDVHTLTTCPSYTQVGDPIAPTCANGGQPGYTIYECNKCGDQFLGNFIDAPEHKWVSTADGKTHKDTTGDCSKGTLSKKWEECSVCGEAGKIACTNKDCKGKCGFGYNEYEVKHNLSYKSGAGCATVYTCSNCKKDYFKDSKGNATQEIAKIGHDWSFTKTIEEPYYDEDGKPVNGLALFTCKTKGCGDTKEVVILAEHECDFERVSGYVAPTCTAEGKYAEYQCAKCLAIEYYVETFDKDGKVTGKTLVTLKEGEANVIAKIPHDLETETLVSGKCEVTGKCKICKKQATNPVDHINLVETPIKLPTCTTIGYTAVACNWCHYSDIELIPALNHTVNGKSVTIEVAVSAANCATKGKTLVLCPLENCGSNKIYNGSNIYVHEGKTFTIADIKETAVDKTKHDIVKTVITEGSCTVNGMYITYCKNGCSEYPYEVKIEPAKGHIESTYETNYCTADGRYYTSVEKVCFVCGAETSTDVKEIAATTTFASTDEAKLYHGLVTKATIPSIDKDGNVTYKTSYPATSATHTFIKDESKSFENTCTRVGYTTWICTLCTESFLVVDAPKPHEPNSKGLQGYVEAKCNKVGNTGYYTCDDCGAYYAEVDGKQVILTSAKGLETNKHSQNLLKKEIKDCTKKVVGSYYECQDCKKAWFEDAKAEKAISKKPSDVSHKYTTINPGVTTTCNTDGIARVRHCATCNLIYVDAITDTVDTILGTDATTGSVKVFTAYSELKNIKIYEEKGITYISYIELGDKDATVVSLTTAKIEHEGFLETLEEHLVHDSDCDNTDPLYIHQYCKLCSYEILKSYTAAHTHINKKGQTLSAGCESEGISDNKCVYPGCGLTIEVINHNPDHKKNTLEKVEVLGTCVDEGYVYYYCTKCDYKHVSGRLAKDEDNHVGLYGQELNYAQNGYTELPCSACGYEGKASKLGKSENGLEILLSAAVNGQSKQLDATYGSVIEITVSLGSLKGVELWGLDFPISYNSNVLEFLSAETTWNQDSAFANRAAADYKAYNAREQKDVSLGIVKVVAHADDAAVSVKGTQELVKLYFKVKYVANADFDYAKNFDFVVADTLLGNDWFTEFTTSAITENNKAIDTLYGDDQNNVLVNFAPIMEADGEYGVNIADIHAIYSLMFFGEYNVAADIDADGKISPEDLRLIYNFVTGATTLESYFNPKSTDSQIQPRA